MEKSSRLRTPGGHRRYEVAELLNTKSDVSLTIGYARVSSHEQKDDLERQLFNISKIKIIRHWYIKTIQPKPTLTSIA